MLVFDIVFMAFIMLRYVIRLKIFGSLILGFYALSSTLVTCELIEMGFRIFCNQTYNRLQDGKNTDYLPLRFETVVQSINRTSSVALSFLLICQMYKVSVQVKCIGSICSYNKEERRRACFNLALALAIIPWITNEVLTYTVKDYWSEGYQEIVSVFYYTGIAIFFTFILVYLFN